MKSEKGFTTIECVIALSIVTICCLVVSVSMKNERTVTECNRNRNYDKTSLIQNIKTERDGFSDVNSETVNSGSEEKSSERRIREKYIKEETDVDEKYGLVKISVKEKKGEKIVITTYRFR